MGGKERGVVKWGTQWVRRVFWVVKEVGMQAW